MSSPPNESSTAAATAAENTSAKIEAILEVVEAMKAHIDGDPKLLLEKSSNLGYLLITNSKKHNHRSSLATSSNPHSILHFI